MSADPTDTERATLVALLRARPRGLSWPRLVSEVLERGGARAAWDALHEQSLFDTEPAAGLIEEAASDLARWSAAGLGVHTFLDEGYPVQLREIHDMPPVLLSRGTVVPDEHAVSVVGSRRASDRGRRNWRRLWSTPGSPSCRGSRRASTPPRTWPPCAPAGAPSR